jgi:hypothetical protein
LKSFNKLKDLQVLLVVSTLQLEKGYGLESDVTSIYSITLRTTSLLISGTSDVIQQYIENGIAETDWLKILANKSLPRLKSKSNIKKSFS